MGYMKKVSNETNHVQYLVVLYCLHKQTDISFWDENENALFHPSNYNYG